MWCDWTPRSTVLGKGAAGTGMRNLGRIAGNVGVTKLQNVARIGNSRTWFDALQTRMECHHQRGTGWCGASVSQQLRTGTVTFGVAISGASELKEEP